MNITIVNEGRRFALDKELEAGDLIMAGSYAMQDKSGNWCFYEGMSGDIIPIPEHNIGRAILLKEITTP